MRIILENILCHFLLLILFIAPCTASRAIVDLNHTLLNGKPLRIMWSRRDPDARNSGIGNLFVKVYLMIGFCQSFPIVGYCIRF